MVHVYVNRPKLVRLGIKHPALRIIRKVEGDFHPSFESGVVKIRKGKVVIAPVLYRDLISAELQGIPLPALVVVGIARFGNSILLGKRSEGVREGGKLGFVPAGHVEFGESPEETLKKELKEETGVEGKPSFLFSTFNTRFLALFYEIRLESRNVKPNWEWEEVFWVREEELEDYARGICRRGILGYLAVKRGRKGIRVGKIEDLEWSSIRALSSL